MATVDPRRVFVIYGRNQAAYDAMVIFLRALGLNPKGFYEVSAECGGTAFVGEVVRKGMENAQAIVAMFTPDEHAELRPSLARPSDKPEEKTRWQSRPNVIFEAGMALGMTLDRTILVVLGHDVELFSDVDGRHIVQLDNSPESKNFLRDKLKGVGCVVDMGTSEHLSANRGGDFESCVRPPKGEIAPQSPFRKSDSPTKGTHKRATIEFFSRLEGTGIPGTKIPGWRISWEVILVNLMTDRTLRDVHINLRFPQPFSFFQGQRDLENWKAGDNPLLVSVGVSQPVHSGERVPLGTLYYGDPRRGLAYVPPGFREIAWTIATESDPPIHGSEKLELETPKLQ